MKHLEFTITQLSIHTTKIKSSDESYLGSNITKALQDMSVEYPEVKFIGYMDGHHFMITSVINLVNNTELTEQEVDDMYYIAFGPECIGIRINDISFEEYMENSNYPSK